jgi:hyperosmotically inducible periplasmic protein
VGASIIVAVALAALVAGCQSLTAPAIAAHVDDSTITGFVKAKLVADGASNLTRIDVDTSQGTVYLSGFVDTGDHRARAEQLAWQARGVKNVVNALQVVTRR